MKLSNYYDYLFAIFNKHFFNISSMTKVWHSSSIRASDLILADKIRSWHTKLEKIRNNKL